MEQEANEMLGRGIFWVVCDFDGDGVDWSSWQLECLKVPCDADGTVLCDAALNSKKGNSWNHKLSWPMISETLQRDRRKHGYNYYPRGRVEIAHGKAVIYLNPHIHDERVLSRIRAVFGLGDMPTKVDNDGSVHYHCFLDDSSIR